MNNPIGNDGENHRRSAAFRGQCPNFPAHLEALTNNIGQVVQNFTEIAAGRSLDGDGGNEQGQIVRADAQVKVAERRFQIRAIGYFIRQDAKFTADRIGHLAAHQRKRNRHRVPGAQAAHDGIERIGELRGEPLLSPPAQHEQR